MYLKGRLCEAGDFVSEKHRKSDVQYQGEVTSHVEESRCIKTAQVLRTVCEPGSGGTCL